nr:hypothetical protein [uncultured Hyphomonas sp.]
MPINLSDLERRIRSLEEDRIHHLALINMLMTASEHLWSLAMQKGLIEDPVKFAEDYLQLKTETRTFQGVDPTYLDVLSQVYEERTEEFRRRLLMEARRVDQKQKGSG